MANENERFFSYGNCLESCATNIELGGAGGAIDKRPTLILSVFFSRDGKDLGLCVAGDIEVLIFCHPWRRPSAAPRLANHTLVSHTFHSQRRLRRRPLYVAKSFFPRLMAAFGRRQVCTVMLM